MAGATFLVGVTLSACPRGAFLEYAIDTSCCLDAPATAGWTICGEEVSTKPGRDRVTRRGCL